MRKEAGAKERRGVVWGAPRAVRLRGKTMDAIWGVVVFLSVVAIFVLAEEMARVERQRNVRWRARRDVWRGHGL
jgi:hypothetical protein